MTTQEKTPSVNLFEEALFTFLIEINALSDALPEILVSLQNNKQIAVEKIQQFLEEKNIEVKEQKNLSNTKDTDNVYIISIEYSHELKQHMDNIRKLSASTRIIPKSFLVAMISQFDAFLGRIIKAMYHIKPEMLNDSGKQLTFSELIKFGSLEVAKEHIIEKEIETVLRNNHVDHFEWLEKKLDITLRKDLAIWPEFVEIMERRNLFVHTDGIVSSQYINICTKQKVSIKDGCKIGTRLDVSEEYYQRAYEVLYEISVKLTQVIRRKLIPSETEFSNEILNQICYELLQKENYNLAKNLLEFALQIPKPGSQRSILLFKINHAIACKWGGYPEKAKTIILNTDWSACSLDFQLASLVLTEKFDEAQKVMKKIGKDGNVSENNYKEWPVFKDFRHTQQFLIAFEEIFGNAVESIPFDSTKPSDDQYSYEKENLINELIESSSFAQTHWVIENLNQYSEFSDDEVNRITEAYVSNTQIYWIIDDEDIKAFIQKIINDYKEKIIPSKLQKITEMLSSDKNF